MSVATRYRKNYDQIARDHVAYWRETGGNPFQGTANMKANENLTVALIEKYAPAGWMLDAGCGMGDLLTRFPGRDHWGTDISEDYLAIARERGLNVARARIEKTPFVREFFDLVVATDVLEHVLDLNRAVRELLRVLRPGGILIVRTPNEEVLAYDGQQYEFVHLRRFDHQTMHLLFGKIFGCEVLEVPVNGDIIHAVVRK